MLNSVLRTALVATLAVTTLAAQPHIIKIPAKRAPTHEALWMMKRVGTPVPSPDGKWVVYPVTEPAYDEKDVSSDLWLVPPDGGAAPHHLLQAGRERRHLVTGQRGTSRTGSRPRQHATSASSVTRARSTSSRNGERATGSITAS
jgi:hypothetical protein